MVSEEPVIPGRITGQSYKARSGDCGGKAGSGKSRRIIQFPVPMARSRPLFRSPNRPR